MKQFFFFFLLMIGFSSFVKGQESYQSKVQAYIEKYKEWAIHEQIRSGVPASITLAQGILETAAGESELANNANNHFGIKCKKSWNGLTYAYTDDAKDECFRKYDSAYYSYRDHSDFLKSNPRYSILFSYSLNDYKSWAHGLKKCGYATNPVYAQKLIKFIEEYDLNSYTLQALNPLPEKKRMLAQLDDDELKIKEKDVEIQDHIFESLAFGADGEDSIGLNSGILEYYVTTKKNGLNGFYAKAGDLLLEYSLNSKIRYSKLLAWNDLMDKPLESTMFIYTESKRKRGIRPTHVVQNDESLHMISQEEGIQLNQLLTLNSLSENDRPAIGSVLFLQSQNPGKITLAEVKPVVPAYLYSNTESTEDNSEENEFISTDHSINTSDKDDQEKEAEFVASLKVDSVESVKSNELVLKDQNAEIVELKEVEDYSLSTNSQSVIKEDGKKTQVKIEEEKELTPLEKLKQYMDNTVYLETEEKEDVVQKEAKQTDFRTTLPAARQKTNEVAKSTVKSAQPTFHIVKKGDTAFKISKQYNISLTQLKQWNHLPASMVVTVGQKLKVKP